MTKMQGLKGLRSLKKRFCSTYVHCLFNVACLKLGSDSVITVGWCSALYLSSKYTHVTQKPFFHHDMKYLLLCTYLAAPRCIYICGIYHNLKFPFSNQIFCSVRLLHHSKTIHNLAYKFYNICCPKHSRYSWNQSYILFYCLI